MRPFLCCSASVSSSCCLYHASSSLRRLSSALCSSAVACRWCRYSNSSRLMRSRSCACIRRKVGNKQLGYLGTNIHVMQTRPNNSRRHKRPLCGGPTNGLGALEISLLFCYYLTCNGALSWGLENGLENGCP